MINENKIKDTTIPIIMLDQQHYKNITEYIFAKSTFPELENLFMMSLSIDASSLIDIPIDRVSELFTNQRDLLFELLNEQPLNELDNKLEETHDEGEEEQNYDPNFSEFKKILCGKTIDNIDKNLIFNKLISLICRRMVIILKTKQKIKIPIDDLKKIIDLLIYENYLLKYSKETEISQIFEKFVRAVTLDDDIDAIKCFSNLDYINAIKNFFDTESIPKANNENELLSANYKSNTLYLIDNYFLTLNEYNKSNILDPQISIDFISTLIGRNNLERTKTLLKIFKHMEKNIKDYIKVIENNKNIFCSEFFIFLFDSCETVFQSKKDVFKLVYEKIELFLVFFNIWYKLKIDYNLDLDINHFENTILFDMFKTLILLQYFN